jgi:threonine/homoserine/homoserine lactone efflux protein
VSATPKPPIPLWRWLLWWLALFFGVVLFYVLFTPIWLGVRFAAWIAELRSRRRTLVSAR